ncbi:hypothetical protein PRIC1_000617 [Phytophthora ramorum]
MAKRALSAVIGLALLVAAQGQESTSASSSGSGSSSIDFWPRRTVVNAGDRTPEESIHFCGGSSSSSHETSITGVVIASSLSRDSESTAPSRSDSGRVFTSTAAPGIILSRPRWWSPPLHTPSTTSSPSVDDAPVNVFQDDASYSAGTVRPTEEQTAIESTALELSTSPDQVDDATETSSPTTSTTATHSSDKKAASTDRTRSKSQGNAGGTSDLATSGSSLSSPIFYACIVLGVAGLVGGVFAFRTRNKRDVSDEWRATSEAAAVTPPLSSHAAWAPPASEVCVVIDDHNFAILIEAGGRIDTQAHPHPPGYVPQDETPKYKTVAQRRREQEAKQAAEEKAGGVGAVDGLQMDKLSLEQKKEAPSVRERPRTGGDRTLRQDQGRHPLAKEASARLLHE